MLTLSFSKQPQNLGDTYGSEGQCALAQFHELSPLVASLKALPQSSEINFRIVNNLLSKPASGHYLIHSVSLTTTNNLRALIPHLFLNTPTAHTSLAREMYSTVTP